jgi:hypothetical protein
MNDQTFADILARQFGAALQMLRTAIARCPDELWARREEREAPFWQHAVHVLFYTRLFFFESLAAAAAAGTGGKIMKLIGLTLKDTSEAELNRMAATIGYTGLTEATFTTPRTPARDEILLLLDETQLTFKSAIEQIRLPAGADAPNPMPWMRGTRGELLLYSLRHLHQHLGRLHSMLGRAGVKVDWIGGLPQT